MGSTLYLNTIPGVSTSAIMLRCSEIQSKDFYSLCLHNCILYIDCELCQIMYETPVIFWECRFKCTKSKKVICLVLHLKSLSPNYVKCQIAGHSLLRPIILHKNISQSRYNLFNSFTTLENSFVKKLSNDLKQECQMFKLQIWVNWMSI